MRSSKISDAQLHIDGKIVAQTIMEFHREFDGVYLDDTMSSSLCAVGPLQSMIGLAISNGLLALPPASEGREVTEEGGDYFASLVVKARQAAAKASSKFPQPNYVTLKIAEEAGEVVRGAVHYAENRMEWSEVEGEVVQLLAMLIRFVTEGDEVNGIIPPPRAALSAPKPVEGYVMVPLSPDFLDDKAMGDELQAELKKQGAFSIERYGKIALATYPFGEIVLRRLLAAAHPAPAPQPQEDG